MNIYHINNFHMKISRFTVYNIHYTQFVCLHVQRYISSIVYQTPLFILSSYIFINHISHINNIIISMHFKDLHLDDLWTQGDLKQMVLTTKKDIPLPKNIETEVLQSVMVLLVTMNLDESLATCSYLQPLDGHGNIYRFSQGGEQSNVIYCIGKYGACSSAIRDIPPVFELHGSTNAIPTMAEQCFPNLSAIISVGVACGIPGEVKLCDVLVSSEVVNYDETRDKQASYYSSVESMVVSSQLSKLFTQPDQWPNESIIKRLNDNGVQIPNVKSGLILSGPYLDDLALKSLIRNSTHGVIGIEMGRTNLFLTNQGTTAHAIIVKAVCDFGDGKSNKTYQPTAALLAADFIDKCLSDSQAHETLQGLHM